MSACLLQCYCLSKFTVSWWLTIISGDKQKRMTTELKIIILLHSPKAGANFGAIYRKVKFAIFLFNYKTKSSSSPKDNIVCKCSLITINTHRNKAAGTVGGSEHHRRGAQESFVGTGGDKVRQNHGKGQDELDSESLPGRQRRTMRDGRLQVALVSWHGDTAMERRGRDIVNLLPENLFD